MKFCRVVPDLLTTDHVRVFLLYLTQERKLSFSTFNQGPYDMAIAVNPSKVNSVVIHNSYLHRSTDGFATSGTNQDYSAGPDSMSIVFDQE